MSIPSQLPQIVTAARAGALQALALQAGQMVDGRIIGAAPNGGTQVEIRGQMLNLLLPTALAAGATVKFEVQGSGPQLRLALQANPTAAAQPAANPVPAQRADIVLPPSGSPPAASVAPEVMAAPGQAVPAQAATVAVQATPNMPQPAGSPPAPLPTAPYAQAPAAVALPVVAAPVTGRPATPQSAPAVVPAGIRPVSPSGTSSTTLDNRTGAPPTTPQAALAQMVQGAVLRQGPVTNLTAALVSIAGHVLLPEPVARAAQQVMAGRMTLDTPTLDGPKLQAAMRGSGVFQEASLARGQVALPQGDMKSALLGLRQTLVNWLGQQAPVTAVVPIAPPLKGSVPRARGGDGPPMDAKAAPEVVGRHLLERTEAALARVRLHQHASLPEPLAKSADWSLDLPVVVGGQQMLMQMHIHRDQHNEGESAEERGWQMRFAINLPGMGEVGAQVSLRGGAAGVMLWATEPGTSAALEAGLGLLREGLAEAGLKPGAVIVRHGAPASPPAAPVSGHFMDAST